MHYLTVEEARARCDGIVRLDERGWPIHPSAAPLYARAPFSALTELTSYCQYLERSLRPREACDGAPSIAAASSRVPRKSKCEGAMPPDPVPVRGPLRLGSISREL